MHGDRFVQLVKALQERYEYVFFDSPPVLGISDALIMAGVVKRVLLVAKHGKTSKTALVETRERLDGVGAKTIGAILNLVDIEKKRYGYYYSYYRKSDYTSEGAD